MKIADEHSVKFQVPPFSGFDHWPFYLKGKPIFHLLTGLNSPPYIPKEYHRFDDMYPDAIDNKVWRTSFSIYLKVIEEIQKANIEI